MGGVSKRAGRRGRGGDARAGSWGGCAKGGGARDGVGVLPDGICASSEGAASSSDLQAMRKRACEEAARAFLAAAGPPSAATQPSVGASQFIPRGDTCRPTPASSDAPSPPPPAAEPRTQPPTPTPPADSEEKPTSPVPTTGFVTMWTCDVCRVAQFESFDEAVEHEKTCDGNPPPPCSAVEEEVARVGGGEGAVEREGDSDSVPTEEVQLEQLALPEELQLAARQLAHCTVSLRDSSSSGATPPEPPVIQRLANRNSCFEDCE